MRFPAHISAAHFLTTRFLMTLLLVPGVLSSLGVSACRADAPPVQDIFVGNGTPGPFALSWNSIQANTETVVVNGQAQLRNLDYTLNPAAGTVTFTRSFPANTAIEVSYAIVPGQSQHTGGGRTIPLSVDLLRDPHGYFSLDALGKTADGAANNLTLGAGLGWHGSGSNEVSSRFLYTPVALGSGDAEAGASRTGMAFSAATGGKWGGLTAGFSRAGAEADTGSDSAFQSGHQLLTLGGTLTSIKAVSAKLSFSRSTALDSSAGAAGVVSGSDSLALTVTPTDKTKVQATLAETSAGPGQATQSAALSMDTQAAKTVAVSAAFNSQNLPGTASDSQTVNLKTTLTPSKTYSLQAAAQQSQIGDAASSQQAVTLTLTPQPTLQLQAGFALRQQSATGSPDTLGTSVASLSGTVRPLPLLTVSGSYKSRTAPADDTNPSDLLDTSTAQIAFSPLKTFKLTGTYAQNPDNGTDTLQRIAQHGVGLETSFGALGLSGGCDWSHAYDTPDDEQTIHAALGLNFSKATKLSVGYQTQQNLLSPDTPLATAYTGRLHAHPRRPLQPESERQAPASRVGNVARLQRHGKPRHEVLKTPAPFEAGCVSAASRSAAILSARRL